MLVAEIADRNQTKSCSGTKKRRVGRRRVSRSRGRSRGRSRSRIRSRNRSHGGGITGRRVYGSTARAVSKAARRAGAEYSAEGHRRSSSSPSREECKGGEEKERSGSDTCRRRRRRDDEPRRRRDRHSPRRQSSSKGRLRSSSRRPSREREGGRSSRLRRGFRWGGRSSCGSGKKRNTSGSNRTQREDRSRSGVRGPRWLAWADDNVPRPSRDRGNVIYHSESHCYGNGGGGSRSCCSGSSSSRSRRKRNLPPRARYTRSSTTRRRRKRQQTGRRRRWRRRSLPGQEWSRQSAFETSESGSSVSFLSSSSSSSPRRHGGRARFDGEGRRRQYQHRRDRGLEPDSSSSAFGGSGRRRRRRRERSRKSGRHFSTGGPGRRRGAWNEDGATEPSRSSSSSCRDYSSSEGSNSSYSSGDGQWEEDIDSVWRGFLTVSRRVPGGKFAPLERKGVGDKNRAAVERARLQRERERYAWSACLRERSTERE